MKKIAVLLLALLLIPCAALGETVKVSEVTHSVFYAPQYVALGLGFFEEEGLQIDLMNGGGADKVMTSVLTGEADIGLAGPEACIYVLLAEHDDAPRVFAQLTCRDGSFLVGREQEDFSWENLRGKQIIGGRKGGMPEMTLEYVMKQHGVIPGVDAQVDTSVQFNMMAGAFIGGDADYVALFEPTATEAELAGQCVVLTSIGKESGESAQKNGKRLDPDRGEEDPFSRPRPGPGAREGKGLRARLPLFPGAPLPFFQKNAERAPACFPFAFFSFFAADRAPRPRTERSLFCIHDFLFSPPDGGTTFQVRKL